MSDEVMRDTFAGLSCVLRLCVRILLHVVLGSQIMLLLTNQLVNCILPCFAVVCAVML